MYEFWYDYIKPKYGDNVYIKKKIGTAWADKDSIYHNVKLKDYLLPIGKNKKVIKMIKDELGGGITTILVNLGPKTYSYKKDNHKK